MTSRTARNLAWTAIALVGSKGTTFLATILIARAISPQQFGDYIVMVAVAAILIPVLDAGFSGSVTRAASRRVGLPLLSFTSTAARMRLPTWGCALVLGVGAGLLGLVGHWELLVLAIVAAIGQTQLDTMSGEFRAVGRYRMAALREAASGGMAISGAAVLLLVGGNATGAMLVFAVARVLPALAFLPMIPRARAGIRSDIPWRAGLTMGLTGILIALYVRSDVLLLSSLKVDPATIARYGIIYSLVIAFQIIPTAITNTVFPRLASGSDEQARNLALKGMSLSYLSSALLCAVCFLAPGLVLAPFGKGYAQHASQVLPLLLIILPISLSQVAAATLQARNHESLLLRLVVIVAVLNIGLNVVLIPVLGVKGAIIATMSGELCAAALTLTAMRRLQLGSLALGYVPAVAIVLMLGLTVSGPLLALGLLASAIALWLAGIISGEWLQPTLSRRRVATSTG